MPSSLIRSLLSFLQASPTPHHAVANVVTRLNDSGFKRLQEGESWDLKAGEGYYFTRRDASILAFRLGTSETSNSALRIVGAHTDSPTLKLKPKPEQRNSEYCQWGVEVYGGALLSPWFDRDLSVAGRVGILNQGRIEYQLVDFKSAIATIPSLAIHLNRTANDGHSINSQTEMRPIWAQAFEQEGSWTSVLLNQLQKTHPTLQEEDILEHELYLYDVQAPSLIGLNGEFVASARLDNLLSCFLGLQALVETSKEETETTQVLALFDHEEVGSRSDIGAQSNMLDALIDRLCPTADLKYPMLARSMLVSTDNAHGVHPNYRAKHDEDHSPLLNKGPVIKYDANQSYATCLESAATIRTLAADLDLPLQSYVTRSDMRCGSTIGPMSAAKTGMATVDVGLATFAMHSIREMAGAKDSEYLNAILKSFFKMRSISR